MRRVFNNLIVQHLFGMFLGATAFLAIFILLSWRHDEVAPQMAELGESWFSVYETVPARSIPGLVQVAATRALNRNIDIQFVYPRDIACKVERNLQSGDIANEEVVMVAIKGQSNTSIDQKVIALNSRINSWIQICSIKDSKYISDGKVFLMTNSHVVRDVLKDHGLQPQYVALSR